jgi:hypothetical protein
MIPLRISIVAGAAALVLILVVFELVRRRRLDERYALLWLVTGVVILVLAVWRSALDRLALLIDVSYPPSILFALAGVFILLLLLHLSSVISKLTNQNKRLAQRVAILEGEMRESLEGKS